MKTRSECCGVCPARGNPLSAFAVFLFTLIFAAGTAAAQATQPSNPPPEQGNSQATQDNSSGPMTLHVRSRVVLTDVTVTDRSGVPVRNIPKGDFRILDNGHEQTIASFEEHQTGGSPMPLSSQPQGFYSNVTLQHPPAVVNVLLLDCAFMDVVDQMYLYHQLSELISELPPDQPIAIYARSGDYAIPLQDFTSDHEKLQAALSRAIPHIHPPADFYYGDFSTLEQMTTYLGQIPGRKNVLWFSSGGHLELLADPTLYPQWVNLHELYDQLEAERIAIYPIDVRGLTTDTSDQQLGQHLMMNEVAQATGGQAFFNTNGVREAALNAISRDGSYYTITYQPTDLNFNGKWHRVKVEIAGNKYDLGYRSGYYDDTPASGPLTFRPRPSQQFAGPAAPPDLRSTPIPLQARVLPSSNSPGSPASPVLLSAAKQKRGETLYNIHFQIPASDVAAEDKGDGHSQATLGVAALGFSQTGRSTSRDLKRVIMTLNNRALANDPNAKLTFDQQVSLPQGQDFIFLAVWDMKTGRLGTLQVPVDVSRSATP